MMTLTNTHPLETSRLMLRPPQVSDWEAIAAFLTSERASFVGGPYSRPQAWRLFSALVGHWTLRGYGMFVGTHKETQNPICAAGPWMPEGWPELEIGWSLWDATLEGQGFAYEAAFATRDWAFTTLQPESVVSYINVNNTRSANLASRLGCSIDHDAQLPLEMNASKVLNHHVWRHQIPKRNEQAEGHP